MFWKIVFINKAIHFTYFSPQISMPQYSILNDVTIVDFTRLLPGPLATQMLADLGAKILKIESEDTPDYLRFFPPQHVETSAYFKALNYNKQIVRLNYKTKQGQSEIYDLIKSATIVVEQFRPGVMKNYHLDYETLCKINPRIIYVSISGYGQKSVRAHEAGHDLNYLALSGLLSITGTPEKPIIPGMQIADVAGGSYMAVNACLAALCHLKNTGEGQYIDVAMTDSILPLMTLQYAQFQAENEVLRRGSFELAGSQPNYNVYCCSDQQWVALGALEFKFWKNFCEAVQQPSWIDNCFLPEEEKQHFFIEIKAFFQSKPRAYWLEIAAKHDVCLSPILQLNEIQNEAHWKNNDIFMKDKDGFIYITQPIKFGLPTTQNFHQKTE